jgi:hypothetical protein
VPRVEGKVVVRYIGIARVPERESAMERTEREQNEWFQQNG